MSWRRFTVHGKAVKHGGRQIYEGKRGGYFVRSGKGKSYAKDGLFRGRKT